MFRTDNIQCLSEREEDEDKEKEVVHSPAHPSIYTEILNPPLVEDKTPISKIYKCLGGNKNLLSVTLSVLSSA
jgi:hypothetical protein